MLRVPPLSQPRMRCLDLAFHSLDNHVNTTKQIVSSISYQEHYLVDALLDLLRSLVLLQESTRIIATAF